MKRFEGRTALVTGASRGIGEAIARRLAGEGASVIAAARTEADLARVVAEIAAGGGAARPLTLDLADGASIQAASKGLLAEIPVDILVNNAGVTDDNLVLRMSRESWDRVIGTNLTGVFLLTQAVIKTMVRRRFGRIVNVTSVVGMMGNAGQANYAASKAGLIGFTKSIARELASRNITCNAVAPGFIETSMTGKMTEEARKALSDRIPLARLGTADDVAAAVSYLASEDAAYVTGHVMNVSGGLLI